MMGSFETWFPFLCLGKFSRASYSNGVPNKAYCSGAVSSIGQDKLPAEGFTHQINGTNGLSSKLFSRDRRLLDAVDDQYDGIVIDPNGLPSNPVVFSSNLRFSLSHWKKKVKLLYFKLDGYISTKD